MAIERELMRSAMLEALRRQPPQQFINFQHHVAAVLQERGLAVEGGMQPTIRRDDDAQFLEILFELLHQGILIQAKNSNNAGWPWLGLTARGKQYLEDSDPDAHDPDGYLASLDEDEPLDDVERRYLAQAAAAFRADLPDAAAVMLGAASEHLLLRLAEAIVNTDAGATKIAKAINGPALPLLRAVNSYLDGKRSDLPRELREQLDTTFAGVASVIRTSRNDGGHPALPSVDRETVYVLLRMFATYRRWVIGVIGALPL